MLPTYTYFYVYKREKNVYAYINSLPSLFIVYIRTIYKSSNGFRRKVLFIVLEVLIITWHKPFTLVSLKYTIKHSFFVFCVL